MTRAGVRDPEKEKHAAPVDQACTFNGMLHAIEHTELEPYSEHIRNLKHNPDLLTPVTDQLAGFAGATECYHLMVPINAAEGIGYPEHPKIQAALVDWIRKVGPTIEPRPYGSRNKLAEVQPPGVPFSVRLARYAPRNGDGRAVRLCLGRPRR